MISPNTIRAVQEKADIMEVIERYAGNFLKKKGANYSGCCPFHKEKTGSFSVSVAKQIFKCFGCGKGGDAIAFAKEHEKITFSEAIEQLAAMYHIEVQFEKGMDVVKYKEHIEKEKERSLILAYAEDYYHQTLLKLPSDAAPWKLLNDRGITEQFAIAWRIGFAPDRQKNITDTIINRAWYNTALEMGIINTKSGVSYDLFRNRIMLPIKDHNGNISGFSGRRVDDTDTKYPKYINSSESPVYDKKSTLFGLYEAKAAIKQYGYAYLVEGNFDVIAMHLAGIENTVAPCGTSLTPEQVRLLKRFTQYAVIIGDGDSAGVAAMDKQIDLFLQHDFRVEVVELPTGQDPDSFIRSHTKFKTHVPENEVAAA